jgi:hypothetical protein
MLVLAALYATIQLDPDRLGLLAIVLPLLAVLLLGGVAFAACARRTISRPIVPIALMEALLLGWALAAAFPVSG